MASLRAALGGVAVGLMALSALVSAAPPQAPSAGQFLVASRDMRDPRFARTVVLLVAHGPDGALGVVVNRPTRLALARAFPDLDVDPGGGEVLWYGGPVEHQRAGVLMATDAPPQPSTEVVAGLHFSGSSDVLQALLAPATRSRFRVYAGYAGWGPQQLEGELARGDWTLRPASVAEVFTSDGEGLWKRLIGAPGTWVRRDAEAGSAILARHLQRIDDAAGGDAHDHENGAAAHVAVLHVPGVPRRAVHHQLQAFPAVRAGH